VETPPQRFVGNNQENDRYYPDLSFGQIIADLGQRDALLWTDLPRGLPGLRGHCRVYIRLIAGKMAGGWVERQGKTVDAHLDLNSLHTVKSWTARVVPEERGFSQGLTQQVAQQVIFPPVLSPSHDDHVPSTQEPAQMSPRSFRGPAQMSPRSFRGPAQMSPRSFEQPAQMSPRSFEERIPRKREQIQLNEANIQHWPARERMCLRMVLLMVDGKRSIRAIKEQLQLPPEMIERYLALLTSMHIIEI
jgi:hypothetical protein